MLPCYQARPADGSQAGLNVPCIQAKGTLKATILLASRGGRGDEGSPDSQRILLRKCADPLTVFGHGGSGQPGGERTASAGPGVRRTPVVAHHRRSRRAVLAVVKMGRRGVKTRLRSG